MNRDLLEEAKRVQQLHTTLHRPGVHIVAVFRDGPTKLSVDFFNPKDIPPTWTTKYGTLLYLYTIQTFETWQEQNAHQIAKQCQWETLDRAKRSLHGSLGRHV